MPAPRCRHCDAILLAEEVGAQSCPACGAVLAERPADATAPPLVEPLPEARRPWGLIAALLAQALLIGWLWLGRPAPPPPVEDTDTYRALLADRQAAQARGEAALAKMRADLAAARTQKPAKPEETPGRDRPTRADLEKQIAELNKAFEQVAKGRADALAKATAAEKALEDERAKVMKPAPPAVAGAARLDDPAGTHIVEAINNGDKVKLSGRIGTLRVRAVNDGELDASALQAKVIIFDQPVHNKSVVKLRAPGGAVALAGINGEARVEIDAPGGVVSTGDLNSESRLTARAREVRFTRAVQGGSVVNLTLTAGGAIAFKMIQGSARVTWKKDKPSDPAPRIDEGEVRGDASFRKEG